MMHRRIGIIGAGVIGKAIYQDIAQSGLAEVAFVLASRARPEHEASPFAHLIATDPVEVFSREVDLVIEAAHPDVLAALGPRILAFADLCGFSCTALARPDMEETFQRAATAHGSKFFVPHGAVLGLDGLTDGRNVIHEVVITTTKSATSFGLDKETSGVIFDGTAREACCRFPRNVNVHAAVAIAGIGFDRTRSVVVAKPDTKDMRHRIEVRGEGLEWDLSVSSVSLGGVSGAYTPKSAVGTVQRLLGTSVILNA